jgi:hypothetical protein
MGLERMLAGVEANGKLPTPEEVQVYADLATKEYRHLVDQSGFADLDPSLTTQELVDEQCATVEALTHGYARIVLPWLSKEFKVLSVESEEMFNIHGVNVNAILPPARIHYMARPDFIAQHCATQTNSIHDFKTASYWSDDDAKTWKDSLQMMLNAYCASQRLKIPITQYYIHILIKGNRKSPSNLTYPYYRPGIPPLQQEDWIPFHKFQDETGRWRNIGKNYQRVKVWEHRSVGDWVWDMPEEACARNFVIAGPFNVSYEKVEQFLRGLPAEERWWMNTLSGIDWSKWADENYQKALDEMVPRTYSCYSYGTQCQFYNLCFKKLGWQNPLTSDYQVREPHHTTEVIP